MRTITLLLLALVLVAGAETVTFQPDAVVGKDAYCHWDDLPSGTAVGEDALCYDTGGERDRSPGNRTELGSGHMYSHFGDAYEVSFIEFTELNDSQYQGATVTSAYLRLFVKNTEANMAWHRLGAVDREWDEGTISWGNRPGCISGSLIEYCVSGDNRWVQVNVTSHVQKWLDGTWENYGFILTADGGWRYWCHSSDYSGDPTLRPKLVLSYSGATVEEATWGQIKATF